MGVMEIGVCVRVIVAEGVVPRNVSRPKFL
jgi:hypothetical protein